MFKLLVPLLAKNSCYENANIKAAYCIKNTLISSSLLNTTTTKNVMENLTLRRHFLFSTTNRKTIEAFPLIPQHQLGVSTSRYLGQQLELLPTNNQKRIITFNREYHSSSVLLVESKAVDVDETTTTLKEKPKVQEQQETKRDSFNRTKQTSLFEQEDYLDEENTFGKM